MGGPKQQRFALLVGIQSYHKAKIPERSESQCSRIAMLTDLRGCANDVHLMKDLLQNKFMFNNARTLISTSGIPSEDPTYSNIKSEFDTVLAKSQPGDVFFFYFAGHGALLRTVNGSPPGRTHDPSLLTVDHCSDESAPAIRGWELNKWLENLHKKQVQVVVCLDSCYSGGCWRSAYQGRTPLNWDPDMGASPSDAADDKEAYWPASRNAGLEKAWSMNPDGFTLMTACSADEIAQEKKGPDGKSYGAFTYHLVEALKNMAPNAPLPSYRLLSDKITKAILGDQLQQQQTPHVYGRDRLAFLETYEAFIAAPIVSTVKDGALVIPTGRFHAVYPGSEFKLGYPWHDTVLRVSGIDKWKCLAKPLRGALPSRLDSTPQVVPSKWGLGEEKYRAFVDKRLGDSFRKELEKHLKELLAGSVEVVAASEADILNQDVYGLLLHPGQNKIDIFAPSEVAGRQGEAEETKPDKSLVSVTASKKQANKFNAKARIPGFTFPGHDGLQLVPKCGIALANLARFKQVLVDMPKMASNNYEPFEWKLDPVGRPKDRKWSFNFQNTGHTELRVTVLSLTPGFAVNQFWPSDSPHWLVPQGKKIPPFALTMDIPKELRGVNDKLSLHRDILRVMVTDGEGCSWRCLELPEIWQVDAAIAQNARNRESTGRNPGMAPSDPQWWINDIEVYTSSRAS